MKIHRAFSSYDATRPLAPWVSRIAYNECLHRVRGAMVRATRATDPSELPPVVAPSGTSPEAQVAQGELETLLTRASADLSAQDRALLTLRYAGGLSDSEVAEAVGMPINTVKTRISRAKALLKERLTAAGVGEP